MNVMVDEMNSPVTRDFDICRAIGEDLQNVKLDGYDLA